MEQALNTERQEAKGDAPARRGRWAQHAANALFYAFLVAAIAAAFFLGGGGGAPRSLGGYSAMVVLTGSMQRELPQGSIVVVRQTDPAQIAVGDNITYMMRNNTSITHKVMEIYEDYEGSGMRGFLTQGTENPYPDDEVVFANNVVGKVAWHSAYAGQAVGFLMRNWVFAIIIGGILLALSASLKAYFSAGKAREPEGNPAQTAA